MPWRRAERSELVHIVVTGYQKRKYPRKYYVFVIDVTWNNSDRFEIYRRYSEFFSFQTTLKGLFPDAAGRRNAERTIPQLPKRIFVGRSHVAKVAEARLEQINRYCQTLVSLDPKISESSHVIGFFSPRIGDKALPKLHLHRPASLHPQKVPAGSLFEEYCALAEFHSDDPSQVSFVSGQIVLVLNKDSSGWWLCKVDNKVGWAPPSYLKKVDNGDSTGGESDSDDEYLGVPGFVDPEKEGGMNDGLENNQENKTQLANGSSKTFNVPEIEFQEYRAIDSYEAQGDGQVSFEEGDIIQVLDKIEDGWWFVAKGQEEGWVPCSYLEPTKLQDEDNTISSLDVEHYITVEEYTAEEEDELSFPKGVVVDVLQKSLDGWWLIKYDGIAALAPATFLVKKDGGENSPVVGRKASIATLVETPEEGARSESRDGGVKTQVVEKVNSLTRFQQPPRKQSVRMRVSIRKMGNVKGVTGDGIRAPPTIKEESPTPMLSQGRKLSLESSDPTQTTSLPTKQKVVRKLSEQPIPTQERVLVNPNLPGVRKISFDAALSGAPKIAANGALVHQIAKTPPPFKSPVVEDADSDPEDHEYLNIDPKMKHQLKLNGFQQKVTSPATSDSEVDSSSSSWAGKKDSGGFRQAKMKELQNHFRQWDRRQSSDSEDSLSSPPTASRPPIATPRAKKPELKPKPMLIGSHQVPPRPNRSQIDRARGKQTKESQPQSHPQAEKQPCMPQRPRGTEIRRARLGKQTSPVPPSLSPTHTPSSTPTITATSTKGNQCVVLSSKNSAFTPISPRRSPSPNRSGLAVVREEGIEEAEPASTSESKAANRPYSPRGKFPNHSPSPSPSPVATLAPPQNTRKSRSHSESDTQDLATSPTLSPSASPVPPLSAGISGVNPFNQQMAETIIKYILASPDGALKNALRDCIMSDPEAMKALQK